MTAPLSRVSRPVTGGHGDNPLPWLAFLWVSHVTLRAQAIKRNLTSLSYYDGHPPARTSEIAHARKDKRDSGRNLLIRLIFSRCPPVTGRDARDIGSDRLARGYPAATNNPEPASPSIYSAITGIIPLPFSGPSAADANPRPCHTRPRAASAPRAPPANGGEVAKYPGPG